MTRPDCPQGGEHPEPPYLYETLPPVATRPILANAISAAYAECEPCVLRHRRAMRERPGPANQAVALWLVFAAIIVHERGDKPGDTALELMERALAGYPASVGSETATMLRAIHVDETEAPVGGVAATWDRDHVSSLVALLLPAAREEVFTDALSFLVGVVAGHGRAREEQAG